MSQQEAWRQIAEEEHNYVSYRERYERQKAKRKAKREEAIASFIVYMVLLLIGVGMITICWFHEPKGGYYAENPNPKADMGYIWVDCPK